MAIYIALDFETSGPRGYSACSIGLAKFENGKLIDEFSSLIRPPSSRIMFTNIHGLRWKDLKDAPDFPSVWQEISTFMRGADYLAAHNAPFDKRVLFSCCEYYNQTKPNQPFLCTLKGARQALAITAYNLQAVSDYFGFELNHHEALSDARNCGRILSKLLKMGLNPEDMMCR